MLASRHRREIVSGVVAPVFVYVVDHMPAREGMTKEILDNYDVLTPRFVGPARIFNVTIVDSGAFGMFLTPQQPFFPD